MKQITDLINVQTKGPSLIDITSQLNNWIALNYCNQGILNIFLLHTSASLLIQENADPLVLEDLTNFFSRLVPISNKYKHQSEGDDDMPAHIKSSITNTDLSLSIKEGILALGTWQAIYLFEHRTENHNRKINLHFMGS